MLPSTLPTSFVVFHHCPARKRTAFIAGALCVLLSSSCSEDTTDAGTDPLGAAESTGSAPTTSPSPMTGMPTASTGQLGASTMTGPAPVQGGADPSEPGSPSADNTTPPAPATPGAPATPSEAPPESTTAGAGETEAPSVEPAEIDAGSEAPTTEGGEGGSASLPSEDAGGANGGDTESGEVAMSTGCGNAPTLMNSPSPNMSNYNTLTSGGAQRRYLLRLPEDYDNTHPHRLILGFHGATNRATDVSGNPAYFGLSELAQGSTIFVAPEAVDGIWSADSDVTLVDDILEQVEADLCIDTTRVIIQGFSQGGAMVRTLACERPGVFRAAVAHSAGGLALPNDCDAIPYLGSLGLQENGNGGGQGGQTDPFATWAGCSIETLPSAPNGGHVCSDYSGCSDGNPVRWCSFDGPHTPLPNDAGQNSSWMPAEVWEFLSQF